MIDIHYAIQTCDVFSNQRQERYCSNNRTLISKKCIKSFLESVNYVSKKKPEVNHTIKLFDDHSSQELVDFLKQCISNYSSDNIKIELESLSESGIMQSIGSCYSWLKENGKDLVYQVQDDYLFEENAIYDMIDIFMQVYSNVGTMPMVTGYHDPRYWRMDSYRYKSTPRMVIPGINQYWMQCFDISCSFMTGHQQLVQNWDMLEYFLTLDPTDEDKLENVSLNRILVDRGQLGLMPFNSLTLHMQGESEKDPYIDWTPLWSKQEVESINLPEKVVLNIGSGKNKLNFNSLKDFKEISYDADVKLKPDIVGDILKLDVLNKESVDVIWASHIVEHLHTKQVPNVLQNINRILKKNGLGIIVVPNIKEIGKELFLGKIHKPVYVSDAGPITPMDILYGAVNLSENNDFMMHKTGFTEEYASELLGSLNINGYVKSVGHNLFILICKNGIDKLCVNVDDVMEDVFSQ
jgi:SAM-dependent methyltransferase